MSTVVAWVLKAVLLVAGLVFALSLLVALLVLALAWALRALWARLTGRPVTPWVMRVDPRTAWSRMRPQAGPFAEGSTGPVGRRRPELTDVTDVEPRAPRS